MKDLRQLLWRHDAGLAARFLVERTLAQAVDDLLTRFRASEADWRPLTQPGRPERALRNAFDRDIDDARRAITWGQMRRAWRRVRDAQHTLERLDGAVLASQAIDAAEKSVAGIPGHIAEANAHVASTVQIAKRLLARSREEQASGDFNAARYMAKLCRMQIEQRLSLNSAVTSTLGLPDTIAALRAVDAHLLKRWPSISPQMTFTSALDTAARLIEQQQLGLAEQLVADLAEATELRAAFLRELERQFHTHPNAHPDALEEAVRRQGRAPGESWKAAITRILETEIQRVSAYVQTINVAPESADASTRGFQT